MNATLGPDDSVSSVVTRSVCELEGCRLTDLPPLQETLDVDAVETLVCSATNKTPTFDGSITFEYSDSQIAILVNSTVFVVVSPKP